MTNHQGNTDSSSDGDAIKVFVRIRPPDTYDTDIGQALALKVLDENSLVMNCKPESRVFTFDQVADVTSTQESLFNVIGRPIIDCSVRGYNGTIFAYGQTGSGKTHTMLGPCEDADNFQHELRGIIPRSFENLFNLVAKEQDENIGKEFLLKCSFLEIYREDVFDLLEPSNRGLHLRENMKKGVFVEGLVETAVTSASEAYQVLNSGWINRRVASTSMNRESSRSHAVFTVSIESKEKKDGVQNLRMSQLNLVDLAGSERQKDTNAVGKRLKEAGSINKSLSVLGNVINSLVHISHGKTRHIPYRDSKLTFLLRDSLGGNAKTHIIACVHPGSKCFGETLSTLQFAGRAKMIKNKAVINEDSQGNVLALQLEIRKLKEMLQQYSSGSIPKQPSQPGEDNRNTECSVSESEWKERFIQVMLLRETWAHEKNMLQEKIVKLNDQCSKKDACLQSTKMVVKFRENRITQLETALKKNGLEPDDKDTYAEDLKAEIKTLQDQVNQHPMLAKYSMEIQALRSQLKHEKAQKDNANMTQSKVQELERKYRELTQEKKMFTPSQTPKEENMATATVEKYKSQIADLQEEVSKVKQQLTEKTDSAEKEKVELNSEIESLKSTVKDLTASLKSQKLTNKIERETMNDIHLQTITQITTPKKTAYHLRTRLVTAPSSTSSTPNLDDSIPFENADICDEPQPDIMMEQAQQALKDELKILQDKNVNMSERIAEYEAEAIKLRQHISKVDHQNAQLNEILDRERSDLTTRVESSSKELSELQQHLIEAQESSHKYHEETKDLNIMLTSYDKQLRDTKNELKAKTEEYDRALNLLETKLVQITAELENITRELETASEERDAFQDQVERLQSESCFKDTMISELEENLRNEMTKNGDLIKENQVLVQESQRERSNLSEQLRSEERQNEANNETIGNLQRELQSHEHTINSQQKLLNENTEVINSYMTKVEDLKTSLSERNFSLEAEQEKNKELEESLQAMSNEISTSKTQLSQLESEIIKIKEDHQSELANVNEELETMTRNFNVLEEEHQKSLLSIVDLEKEVVRAKEEKDALNTMIKEKKESLETEITDLKQKLVDSEKRLISKESESEEVYGKLIEELRNKNERLREMNNEMFKSMKDLEESKDQKNKENAELKNKLKAIEAVTEEFCSLRNEKQCLEFEMQNKRETMDRLSADVLVRDEQIRGLTEDLEKLKEESCSITDENVLLKSRMEEIEKEMLSIKERNKDLLEENSKLIGHQNHKQKIHYTEKLKDENNFLREQLSKSHQEIQRLNMLKGTPSKRENRSPLKQLNDQDNSL